MFHAIKHFETRFVREFNLQPNPVAKSKTVVIGLL